MDGREVPRLFLLKVWSATRQHLCYVKGLEDLQKRLQKKEEKKIRDDELKDKEKAIIDIYFSNSIHSLLITCPVSCSIIFLSSMWI